MLESNEVYDDLEIAGSIEHAERESGIQSIQAKVFQGTREQAEELYQIDKECTECGDILSRERQLAVPNSKYCVDCQNWLDEQLAIRSKTTGGR